MKGVTQPRREYLQLAPEALASRVEDRLERMRNTLSAQHQQVGAPLDRVYSAFTQRANHAERLCANMKAGTRYPTDDWRIRLFHLMRDVDSLSRRATRTSRRAQR